MAAIGQSDAPRRKVVVCKTYKQFLEWHRQSGLPLRDCIYADTPEKLMGLELQKGDLVDLGGAPAEVYQMLLTRFR